MKIVAFNGPPESGKDTAAEMFADYVDKMGTTLPVKFESLSMPLRKVAYELVDYRGQLDGPEYEVFKRTKFHNLGVTGRQLMIDVSEAFLKPTYGIGVMAKLLLERNNGFPGTLLVRDSGFQCEVDPLIEEVGRANLFVVQVQRPGKTFEGDSREWVMHSLSGRIDNSGGLDDLRADVVDLYHALVDNLGWKL